jgi:hypothetical protein
MMEDAIVNEHRPHWSHGFEPCPAGSRPWGFLPPNFKPVCPDFKVCRIRFKAIKSSYGYVVWEVVQCSIPVLEYIIKSAFQSDRTPNANICPGSEWATLRFTRQFETVFKLWGFMCISSGSTSTQPPL